MDIKQVWEDAKIKIADNVSAISFTVYIESLAPEHFKNGTFTLLAPSTSYKKKALDERHFPHIEEALKDVAPIIETVAVIDAVDKEELEALAKGETKPEITAKPSIETFANPLMTFNNFVIGPSNQMAEAAAEAVAKRPSSINPLFIYGGSGLGKTHLLNAIANYIIEKEPEKRVILTSCNKFLSDYVETTRSKGDKWGAFRGKYRDCDVLLIDDMQELTGRTSTQEEFFHTFNDLIEHNRQIVLTSDRAPDEIATLADRMRTRFKSGLVQDIGSPSIEMRMAILETKALQRNQKLPDDIINYLAEYCDANNYNVREMEGALKKVLFYAQIKEKLSPDITDCKDALYDAGSQKVQTTADKIIDEVCKYFSITTEEIKSRSRKKEIVEPRMIAIYLIDEKISMPLSNIALIFGQKDHTSAMHARNKITMDIKNNVPRIKRAVEDISRLVNN